MTRATLQSMLGLLSDSEITSFEHLANRLANDAYRTTSDNGDKYVIKVLRAQNPSGIDTELTIQKQITNTPHYLELKNGKYVGSFEGDYFVISPFIEGQSPKQMTARLSRSFGNELAIIHDSLDPASVSFHFSQVQWLNPTVVQEEIHNCRTNVHGRLQNMLRASNSFLRLDLPKAIIHGDLRPGNVFADDNAVTTIFDFETAEHTFRILDIARTYLALASKYSGASKDMLNSVISGYDEKAHTKLILEEKQRMSDVIRYTSVAVSAWCFNNDEADFAEQVLTLANSKF